MYVEFLVGLIFVDWNGTALGQMPNIKACSKAMYVGYVPGSMRYTIRGTAGPVFWATALTSCSTSTEFRL